MPGWSLLVFFVLTMVLAYLAVYFWNIEDMVTTGYFTLLASVAPGLVVVLVYYGLPTWAFQVPGTEEIVARGVAGAIASGGMEPVAEHRRPFANCTKVFHVREPPCTIGWFPSPMPPGAPKMPPVTTLFLRPETRDRKALAAFRQALARSLLAAVS